MVLNMINIIILLLILYGIHHIIFVKDYALDGVWKFNNLSTSFERGIAQTKLRLLTHVEDKFLSNILNHSTFIPIARKYANDILYGNDMLIVRLYKIMALRYYTIHLRGLREDLKYVSGELSVI